VIAAYNAGEGAVQKYRNTIPPYEETRDYVAKVLASYQKRTGSTNTACLAASRGKGFCLRPGQSQAAAL
jgi:hypothetical protein